MMAGTISIIALASARYHYCTRFARVIMLYRADEHAIMLSLMQYGVQYSFSHVITFNYLRYTIKHILEYTLILII